MGKGERKPKKETQKGQDKKEGAVGKKRCKKEIKTKAPKGK